MTVPKPNTLHVRKDKRFGFQVLPRQKHDATDRATTYTGGICFFEIHELETLTMAVITAQLFSWISQTLGNPISINTVCICRNYKKENIIPLLMSVKACNIVSLNTDACSDANFIFYSL